MNATPRYAVYWAPEPAHALWRAGVEWLGRDPSDSAAPALPGTAREATAAPRRYGFHATLKAPITLRTGASAQDFFDAVHALAQRIPRFAMPRLRVDTLGGFIALRPGEPVEASHALRRLADACVRSLDDWRAPMDAETLQRKLQADGLGPAQQQCVRRWGYAHVFEHWRFHMTLTDTLAHDASGEALRRRLIDEATRHFAAALAAPLACESLCVFVEPAPGAPFVLAQRVPLAA